jgi:hypothetical protein
MNVFIYSFPAIQKILLRWDSCTPYLKCQSERIPFLFLFSSFVSGVQKYIYFL